MDWNKGLLNTTTQLSSMAYATTADEVSIKNIIGETVYHQLLAEFSDLTRPLVFSQEETWHGVVHHTETANPTASHLIDFNRLRRSLKWWSTKACCEKPIGITPARRSEEGRIPATMFFFIFISSNSQFVQFGHLVKFFNSYINMLVATPSGVPSSRLLGYQVCKYETGIFV